MAFEPEAPRAIRVRRFLLTAALLAFGLVVAAQAEAAVQEKEVDPDPAAQEPAQTEFRSAEEVRSAIRSADGVARFEFAARPGVWGDGRSWNISRDDDAGRRSRHCAGCTNGPIRVTVEVEDGIESRVESQVGGTWKERGHDVGRVDAAAAADYLLGLAERSAGLDAESKEEALQAAVSAEGGVDWARLMAMARDRSQGTDVREAALFWTAHEAGARAADGIEEIAVASDEETDVQEAAVFALTQLPEERGTDALLRLARENRNPEIVQSVYFWLGQRDDPRILALFEDVLLD